MELHELSDKLLKLYDEFDIEWVDYGPPSHDDIAVALAGLLDYLDGLEIADDESATIELPNASLTIKRTPDGDEVWFKVGHVEVQDA